MSLKSMTNRKNLGAIDLGAKTGKAPVRKSITDRNEGRHGRSRRMGQSVLSIATADDIIIEGIESNKHVHRRLFNTRGIGIGEFMKTWSAMRGTVKTVASTASTIGFHVALPERME
jgi:hypothetical protein